MHLCNRAAFKTGGNFCLETAAVIRSICTLLVLTLSDTKLIFVMLGYKDFLETHYHFIKEDLWVF